VQRGVAVEHVHRRCRPPAPDVRLHELRARVLCARLGEHLGRAIHAGELRLRPAREKHRREVARAAAEVHHLLRRLDRDMREQVERRAHALAREFQVLGGIPAHVETLFLPPFFAR
jgi:hypothetical protein